MKSLNKKKKEEISQNASNVVFVYDFEHSKWFENKNDSLQMIDFALWRFIIDVALKKKPSKSMNIDRNFEAQLNSENLSFLQQSDLTTLYWR